MLQFQRRFRIFYTGTMHGHGKAEHQTKNINNKGQVKATVKGFSYRQASPYQFTSGTCTLHMSTPNYDAKLARNLTRSLVWPPGGTPRKRWWGCVTGYPSPLSYFTYTIYRLIKNAIPYLRPDRPFNQTLFQIRLKISSLVQASVFKINVYILLLSTILHPLPKKHTRFKTRGQKPCPISYQNGSKPLHTWGRTYLYSPYTKVTSYGLRAKHIHSV